MKRKLSKMIPTITKVILIGFAVLTIGYAAFNLLNNNFHTVIPHKIYRSAQLDDDDLQSAIQKYHIKSVINLRGKNSNAAWYQTEMRISHLMGVKHYDLALHAHGLTSRTQLKKLVNLIEHAPRPVLIHCMGGADRSGLASAIAVILSGDPSVDDFQDQISWQYLAISPSTTGYEVLMNYTQWLTQHHFANSRRHFLNWLYGSTPMKNDTGWLLT